MLILLVLLTLRFCPTLATAPMLSLWHGGPPSLLARPAWSGLSVEGSSVRVVLLQLRITKLPLLLVQLLPRPHRLLVEAAVRLQLQLEQCRGSQLRTEPPSRRQTMRPHRCAARGGHLLKPRARLLPLRRQ